MQLTVSMLPQQHAEFWNDSFWSTQEHNSRKISCQQIWHTYVQESIWRVAKASDQSLELTDEHPIAEVTKHAFILLGEGVLYCTLFLLCGNHLCSLWCCNYLDQIC